MNPTMPPPPPRNPNPSSSSMPPPPPPPPPKPSPPAPSAQPEAEDAPRPDASMAEADGSAKPNPSSSMPPPPPPRPSPQPEAEAASEPDASADGSANPSPSISASSAVESGNPGGDTEMAEAAPPEQRQQPRPRAPYAIPDWSSAPEHPFFLEVLKEGLIVEKLDVSKKGAYMFGRIDLCDFMLEHPTISRFHAVLQFRNDGQVFLYDLGSTHGSSINKTQVKKKMYTPIHVGDVIRFGQSSRLYIFQGPSELMPPEKDMQKLRNAKIQQNMLDREASLLRAKTQAALADGISWGMSEDAPEEDGEDEADEITWQTYRGQLTDRQEKTRSKLIKRMEKVQSAINEGRLVLHEMQVDKIPFHVHTIDLNNAKVLIRPEHAEGAKGKNMIIGEERPKTSEDKILAREVVLEKTPNGNESLKIIVKASRLVGQASSSRGSGPPAAQVRPVRPVAPTGQTGPG